MRGMSKADALVEIVRESRRERSSKTGYKRVQQALDVLGIPALEQDRVLTYLDYHQPNGAGPYPQYCGGTK